MSIHEILKKYWGYDAFRPLQEDIITSVLEGHDTLALLPTGGGKSICFQVPALALDGMCIVVSPLIALMKDQVFNLKKHGINAMAITSGMSRREVDIALDNCIYGTVKFLYVSPERLKTDLFIERLKKMHVGLLAVDEAHCISQWGYDFRPPYLEIAKIKELLPRVPTIALTASATDIVCHDIATKLEFSEPNIFRKSFSRDNLYYATRYTEDKYSHLLKLLHAISGTALVYVRSRHKTEEIASFLHRNKINADFYHAGLNSAERSKRQESWINNNTRVIVSTNAFGMGIDKPDVRLVVHLDIPPDLESYYQEAGRAGRDEQKAFAVLLYNLTDIKTLNENLEQQHPSVEFIKQVYQALSNHFRIAIGSGELESYTFDLNVFCQKYQFKKSLAFYAIKKLENQGFLALNDAFGTRSRAIFKISSQELYAFQLHNPKLDFMIQLMLRMYGGEMATHFVNLDERQMASEMKCKPGQIHAALNELQQHGIIDYEEQTSLPKITLLTPRKDAKTLPLNQKYLLHQRELAEKKIQSIINYAQNKLRCRPQMILEYFDEITDERCGKCDFCKKNNSSGITPSDQSNQLTNELLTFLTTSPKSIGEVKLAFNQHEDQLLTTKIRNLLDLGKIKFDQNQKLIVA